MSICAHDLRLGQINGIYWDGISFGYCGNELHGHGFIDERGEKQSTYDIYNYREFLKRAYVILKEKEPDAIIVGHTSQRRLLPLLSFVDVAYGGEQFLSKASSTPNYCKFMSKDYYRALFGKQFGLVPIFLPAYYRNEEKVKNMETPTESIYAYSLPYDVIVHAHRVNDNISEKVQEIKQKFGMKYVEYIAPYSKKLWSILEVKENDKYTKDNLLIGLYVKKGKMLIAASNLGNKEMEWHIRIKPNKYVNLSSMKVKDERKQILIHKQNFFYSIKIDKYDFVLISCINDKM